jgi:rhodanese-related sulfurtransferase
MSELPLEISVDQVKARLDAGEKLHLIDVREPQEHALCQISGAELVPMNTVPAQLQKLEGLADETPLIIFCHHGMRSLNTAVWLRRQGIENVQSMAGGIDAWSLQVDPFVPRY